MYPFYFFQMYFKQNIWRTEACGVELRSTREKQAITFVIRGWRWVAIVHVDAERFILKGFSDIRDWLELVDVIWHQETPFEEFGRLKEVIVLKLK